ncbi:MAG: hypothetical protein ACE5E6_07225 [Phycisphaerae bacterium]
METSFAMRCVRCLPPCVIVFGVTAWCSGLAGCGLGFLDVDPNATISFRIENDSGSTAEVTIDVVASGSGADAATDPSGGGSGATTTSSATVVRVNAGRVSDGSVTCRDTITISATVGDADGTVVQFSGAGAGTVGFDGSSVGLSGERVLVSGTHFVCSDTIVIRVTDDGTGVGLSTGDTPLGSIDVFSDVLPPPTADGSDPAAPPTTSGPAPVVIRIVNNVEDTAQINIASGDGTLSTGDGASATDEIDVRVPPFTQTEGTVACAQEFIIAAAHLEPLDTTFGMGGGGLFDGGSGVVFHGVVLSGDGTGTAGFGSETIAVERGRLFELDTHFSCGDTITITIDATNNRQQLDAEGNPETDAFGDPVIEYGVGVGTAVVTPGGA